MSNCRRILFGLVFLLPIAAHAQPVEYRFSGVLTGDVARPLPSSPINLVDVPFQISLFGDTDNAFGVGYLGFFNNITNASWEVDGIGTALSNNAQIYSLAGLSSVGFGWDGPVYPLNTSQPAQLNLTFNGNAIGMDSNYSHLASVVDATSISLQTSLMNKDSLPVYSTSLYFASQNATLVLKDISNVSYSVVPVPLPPSYAMFLMGLAGVLLVSQSQRHGTVSATG